MKMNLTYFSLQLKRLFQFLPKLILGTIVLAILAGAIAFYGTNVLYKDSSADKISIALVIEDESTLMDLAMTYLESSESVHSFCNLITTTKKEAAQMLKDESVAASIHFPKNFSKDIITGKNTPATITFSKETGIEQLLFQELTAAASRILNYAQASIYSMGDIYDEYDFREKRSVHYDYINRNTMQTALVRSDLFKTETLSSTEDLSVQDFYIITGILLLLFLAGMSLGKLSLPERDSLARLLTLRNVSSLWRTFWKLMTLCLFYLIIGGFLLLAGCMKELFSWEVFLLLPVLALLLSSQTLFLFTVSSNETTGILLTFFYTIISTLCAGCLIPAAFLPQVVTAIGTLFPAAHIHSLLVAAFTNTVAWTDFISIILFIVLFFILSCLGTRVAERRNS